MKQLEFKIQLKPGTDKEALAMVITYDKCFKDNGHRFIFSTGERVARKGFDPARPGKLKSWVERAEAAVDSLNEDGLAINNVSLKARIELIGKRYQFDGPDIAFWNGTRVERDTLADGFNKSEVEQLLKEEMQNPNFNFRRLMDKIKSKGSNSFFGFWQKVIDGKVKAKSGKALTKNTIKAKKQTLEILQRYQEYADVVLTFDSMNMAFYQEFMLWQETVGKATRDKNGKLKLVPYDINSRGKNIKEIKAILNLARINEYFNHDRYTRWPIPKEKNEVVTLTKEELLKINSLDLSGTKADVRDIFVLSSFLGPRISDYKSFKSDSLITQGGVMYFEYVQEKTGMICKIPVHPIARAILDKRNGEFPQMISEQNFRYAIKEICRAAELNDRVIIKIRNSKPEYKKKWQALSPHSARRTFATSLFYGWFNKPMPASYCMLYTGHSSEKSFLLYINAKAKEVNEKALEYFDLQPQMKVS